MQADYGAMLLFKRETGKEVTKLSCLPVGHVRLPVLLHRVGLQGRRIGDCPCLRGIPRAARCRPQRLQGARPPYGGDIDTASTAQACDAATAAAATMGL